ncbi:acyltransferase domain-containing protein [Streptomyces sp. NPDC057239]|uniref:acyltransferase domain-containing protein n=1 Tax=Streptomyces sp. NPDC057239 TaxID=3346061 RepID=UPI00362E8762
MSLTVGNDDRSPGSLLRPVRTRSGGGDGTGVPAPPPRPEKPLRAAAEAGATHSGPDLTPTAETGATPSEPDLASGAETGATPSEPDLASGAETGATPSEPDLASATGAGAPRRFILPVAAETGEALRRAVHDLAGQAHPGGVRPGRIAAHGTGTHRVVATADRPDRLRDELLARLDHGTARRTGERPALAFLFSGGGPQWIGTGRALLAEPAFRATLDECDRAVRAVTGWSVVETLLADDGRTLVPTDVLQPVLFSVQTALARTLHAWGLRSDLVLGASIGDVAAVVAAGALPLEEGARLIATWSRLVAERASGHGTLIVCDMPREDAGRLSAASGGQLFVASHLAPGQVCLSGTPDGVTEAERELSARGIRTLRTPIDYAGHSSLLAGIAPELVRRIGTLRTRRTAVPYWSTVTGGFVDGAALDAAYWVRNMCEPTLLEEGVRHLAGRRALRIVEISPHPVAMYSVQQTLTALEDTRSAVLAASHRDLPPRHGLEDLAARLWCEGFEVDWSAVGAA